MKQRCGSCRFFEDANLAGSGWCHHPQRKTTSDLLIMVRRNELACRDEWSHSLWEPGSFEPAPASRDPAGSERRVAPATESEIAALLRTQTPAGEPQDVVLNEARLVSDGSPAPPRFVPATKAPDGNGRGSLLGLDTGAAIKRARETYRERTRSQARPLTETGALNNPTDPDGEGAIPTGVDQSGRLNAAPQDVGVGSDVLGDAVPAPSSIAPDDTRDAGPAEVTLHEPDDSSPGSDAAGWERAATRPNDLGAFGGAVEARAGSRFTRRNGGFEASEAAWDAESGANPETGDELWDNPPAVSIAAEVDSAYKAHSSNEDADREPRAAALERSDAAATLIAPGQSRPALRRIETPWSVATTRHPSGDQEGAPGERRASWAAVPPSEPRSLAEREGAAEPWHDTAEPTVAEDPLWSLWAEEEVSEPVAEPPVDSAADAVVPLAVAEHDRERIGPALSHVAAGVPRMCRTCRSFRPGDSGERGWCANQWAFTHRRLVEPDEPEPCETSLGSWWLPADDVCLAASDISTHGQPTPLLDRWLPHHRERVAERKRS